MYIYAMFNFLMKITVEVPKPSISRENYKYYNMLLEVVGIQKIKSGYSTSKIKDTYQKIT